MYLHNLFTVVFLSKFVFKNVLCSNHSLPVLLNSQCDWTSCFLNKNVSIVQNTCGLEQKNRFTQGCHVKDIQNTQTLGVQHFCCSNENHKFTGRGK